MNNKDFIQVWVLGVIVLSMIAGLFFLYLAAPVLVNIAYKASTPIVKVMED